jgi:hypothetical protein
MSEKFILKEFENVGEVRTHLGNGNYSVKENVVKKYEKYVENDRIFADAYHDGVLVSHEDVTDYCLEEILSLQEAAEIWGLDDSTLRKAIAAGKFNTDEYRKTGRNYIIKKAAMERVYGERRETNG